MLVVARRWPLRAAWRNQRAAAVSLRSTPFPYAWATARRNMDSAWPSSACSRNFLMVPLIWSASVIAEAPGRRGDSGTIAFRYQEPVNGSGLPSACAAAHGLDRGVERPQEARAVLPRERAAAAPDLAGLAQAGHQVARGKVGADRVGRERAAVRGDDAGTPLHAAVGERHIGRDHDVALPGPLDDPVVGAVEALGDGHALDQGRFRHAQPAVADDQDLEPVAAGDAVHLLLDRAGVGVDVNLEHRWSASAARRELAGHDLVDEAGGRLAARRLQPLAREPAGDLRVLAPALDLTGVLGDQPGHGRLDGAGVGNLT